MSDETSNAFETRGELATALGLDSVGKFDWYDDCSCDLEQNQICSECGTTCEDEDVDAFTISWTDSDGMKHYFCSEECKEDYMSENE